MCTYIHTYSKFARRTIYKPKYDAKPFILDVVAAITGHRSNGSSNAAVIFMRLKNDHPEVTTNCSDLKFPGRGQRKTPSFAYKIPSRFE